MLKKGEEHFSSKEETLDYFIKKEDIKGNIDLIITTRDDKLLAVQSREDIYFVGDLVEDKEGYYRTSRTRKPIASAVG